MGLGDFETRSFFSCCTGIVLFSTGFTEVKVSKLCVTKKSDGMVQYFRRWSIFTEICHVTKSFCNFLTKTEFSHAMSLAQKRIEKEAICGMQSRDDSSNAAR